MKYIDLTHTLNSLTPVFPGDPAITLNQTAFVNTEGFSDYELKTSMHVGTHIDAPAHMLEHGKLLSEYPPAKFFSRGIVIDARNATLADARLLDGLEIKKNDAVLICFGWSKAYLEEEYYLNYPEIHNSLAKKLSDIGISLLGTDTPSPDRAPYAVHKLLFNKDILIIENLTKLELLIGKTFEFIALPTKILTDSAPCRVIAKLL